MLHFCEGQSDFFGYGLFLLFVPVFSLSGTPKMFHLNLRRYVFIRGKCALYSGQVLPTYDQSIVV